MSSVSLLSWRIRFLALQEKAAICLTSPAGFLRTNLRSVADEVSVQGGQAGGGSQDILSVFPNVPNGCIFIRNWNSMWWKWRLLILYVVRCTYYFPLRKNTRDRRRGICEDYPGRIKWGASCKQKVYKCICSFYSYVPEKQRIKPLTLNEIISSPSMSMVFKLKAAKLNIISWIN